MKLNKLLILGLLILCGIAVFKAKAQGSKKSLAKIVFEGDFSDLNEGGDQNPPPEDNGDDDDGEDNSGPADESDGE